VGRAVLIAGGAALVLLVGLGAVYTPDKSRRVLEARYAGAPSTFLEVEGLRLHVRDTGPRDGPTLLLLHGFGDSLHTWDAWSKRLESRYRVVRIDLPGFALTGPDPSGDYSDARCLRVILALFTKLAIAKATVIGNSMGGRIAWTFAAAHPERVEKLVLISPDGFASPGAAYGVRTGAPLMMRLLPFTLPAFMVRANLAAAYGDPSRLNEATVARTRDLLLAPRVRRAVVRRLDEAVLIDPRPTLRRLRTPTLLLWGDKDGFIPIANAKDYLAALPEAELVTLRGLGHTPQEEAPDDALPPLRAFLP
jgi:pimeloyl-ACP methyl ester carboxylesterase